MKLEGIIRNLSTNPKLIMIPAKIYYSEIFVLFRQVRLKDKYPNFEVGLKCIQLIVKWHYSLYAIVNDQLSALELAITPDMGHGWASDVALSNIHERSSLTSRFLLYKNTKVSIKTP